MQMLRNSVYLVIAVGSIALAACQPPDRFTDAPVSDIAHIADASAQLLNIGSGASRLPEAGGTPQAMPSKPQ